MGSHNIDTDKFCVNQINFEHWDQFEQSMFSDVYQTAAALVSDIIQSNQEFTTFEDGQKFCNENHMANVISFLGERGMGKSSAMLSFAFFLKNYALAEPSVEKHYQLSGCKGNSFYLLSKIDAGMIGDEENLLDFILAKMWDEFDTRSNEKPVKEPDLHLAKERFRDVKKAYSIYCSHIKKAERLQEGFQLNELHELSNSLNLRRGFMALTEAFLKCVSPLSNSSNNTYLVIPIDDLDIINNGAYTILEEIRLFLMIPKVIVLITADFDRLTLEIKSTLSNQLLSKKKENSTEQNQTETSKINHYAHDYLAKNLPRNMRIYMPVFNGMDGIVTLKYSPEFAKLYPDWQNFDSDTLTEKRLILDILAQKMNIQFYPGITSYSFRQKSLRNMINTIKELKKIYHENSNQTNDSEYSQIYQWAQKEILISCKNIERECLKTLMEKLRSLPADAYNYFITNWRENDSDMANPILKNPGYGKVLQKILKLQNRYFQDMEFTWILPWFYSLAISKIMHDKPGDVEDLIVKKDIFSSILSNNGQNIFEQRDRDLSSFLRLKYTIEDDLKETIRSLDRSVIDTFRLLLFCDMDEIFKQKPISRDPIQKKPAAKINQPTANLNETKAEKPIATLKWNKIKSNISIDNLFHNAIFLDKKWESFLHWLFSAIDPDYALKISPDFIHNINIPENVNFDTSEIKKWRKKYAVTSFYDILPIQNISVMLEITDRLQSMKFSAKPGEADLDYYTNTVFDVIINTFEKTEKSYKLIDLESQNLCYSSKISELKNLLNIKNINPELTDKFMAFPGYAVQDTSI